MSSDTAPRRRSRRRHGETHAGRGSAEFRIWSHMMRRCHSPTNPRFADYGGRGIYVCDRWRENVANFIEDMGRRPSVDHQLERKKNDGPYSPDNCVWATRTEQGRNKRNNVLLTYLGRTQPLSAWAEELGLPYTTLRRRILRGWSADEVLGTPVGAADPVRRCAAQARLRPGQLSALTLLATSPDGLQQAELVRRTKCDAKKLRARGYVRKAGRDKYAPLVLTDEGRKVLADARIEIRDGKIEVAA